MGTNTDAERKGKGALGITGSLLQGAQMAAMIPGHVGIAIGALTALSGVIEGISTMYESAAERAERLAQASKEASDNFIQKKAEATNLVEQIEKLKSFYSFSISLNIFRGYIFVNSSSIFLCEF